MEYQTQSGGYRCQQPLYQVQGYAQVKQSRVRVIPGVCTCNKQGPCRGTCLPREVVE